jgi:hypothetical protein
MRGLYVSDVCLKQIKGDFTRGKHCSQREVNSAVRETSQGNKHQHPVPPRETDDLGITTYTPVHP